MRIVYGLTPDCTTPIKEPMKFASFFYLHSDLDNANGCDFCAMSEIPTEPKGKENVKVVLVDGTVRKGRLYWWSNKYGIKKGLIVAVGDKTGAAEARKCFNKNELLF